MAAALEQAYNNDIYRRVLATRSNTEMDKTLGYLKGDEVQKLSPLLRPIFDNIENLHKTEKRRGKKDGVPYEDRPRRLVQTGVVSTSPWVICAGALSRIHISSLTRRRT